MKLFIRMLKPLIKRYLRKALEEDGNQTYLVDLANSKVDIPKLTEEEEKKLLDQIYEALTESAVTFIDRI